MTKYKSWYSQTNLTSSGTLPDRLPDRTEAEERYELDPKELEIEQLWQRLQDLERGYCQFRDALTEIKEIIDSLPAIAILYRDD